MEPMNFKDAFYMLQEVWNLYKKYTAQNLSEKDVEKFAAEMQQIYEKYKTSFAKEIVLAFINEIERNIKFMERGKTNGKE